MTYAIAFSYENLMKCFAQWQSAKTIVGEGDVDKCYAITGHNDFIDHAVRLFYADRKQFVALRDIVCEFLLSMPKRGLAPSSNHLLAALVCARKDNIKHFKRWMDDRLHTLPVDRVRFAGRVMKREKTMDFLVDVMQSNIESPQILPSHLFLLDQYYAGFLPEDKDYERQRVASKTRQLASEANFAGREFEVIHALIKTTTEREASKGDELSAASVLRVIEKPPKIALCISGQLRGFEAAHSRMKDFFDYFKVDRFVHTWGDVGRGMLVPDRADRWFSGNLLAEFRVLCAENKLDGKSFLTRYPAFSGLVKKVDQAQVKSFYNAVDVVVEDDIAMPTNHHRMFYKIWSAHQLMRKSGNSYDVVMRVRPDLVFNADPTEWAAIFARVQNEKLVFVETEFGINRKNGWVGDQFAVGSMDAMDRYASVYPLSNLAAAKNVSSPIVHAHETLGYHMWSGGYIMPRAPLTDGKLTELALISSADALEKISQGGKHDEVHRRLIAAAKADVKAGS